MLVLAAACTTAPADTYAIASTSDRITIDGDWLEPDWNDRALPIAFEDHGAQARPYSEMRFLRDDAYLYIGLYAADENIVSTDRFDVTVDELHVRIDPRGRIEPALSGARAACDVDGSVDSPGDLDEEWVCEVAVPRTPLDGPLGVATAARCDVTDDQIEHCGSVSARLTAL